ncbi:hypothetical protein UZ36_01430 [Candidatus Nitromaritima sp. SCGC AAA799-C22]|nr:hypothetical protein UZ36_01430 [Candidatus Nitromaritima sp. SCGC AAA799-C22]
MDIFGQKKSSSKVRVLARERTDYNDIYVLQNGAEREMWFRKKNDFFLQSRINTKEPDSLVLIYSKMLMATLLLQPAPKRILMIGLGGAAVSNFLARWYPETVIDVVEIDPKVIEASRKFFYLNETSNYRVHQEDGRRFVCEAQGGEPYDLIYLDAFKSGSIPFHLKTVEFYRGVFRILAHGGVVSSNLYGKSNTLKPSDWKTFAALFRQIYCFEDNDNVATVLLATDREETWGIGDFKQAAKNFLFPLPFSLADIAETYRVGKFENGKGGTFQDDFSEEEFDRAIEKNNLDDTMYRPYPIKNLE